MCLFLTAIHQRRHALLHTDQDEWQRERRRERTNPHPRLPQDRSDAALYEPHRQHGTGCLRHVIVTWLAVRNRQGGAEEEHKTLNDLKNHGCPVWPIYSPGCQRAQHEQDLTYCQNALSDRSLQTKNRDSQLFFFLNEWMLDKEILKKRREMCCNKEAVTGACFWIFLQCSFMWGREKNIILQCDTCAVPFRWSCWR